MAPPFATALCHFVFQSYWTLGIAYMDDNVKTGAAAAVIGVCYMVGFVGGFLGKLLGSACLKLSATSLNSLVDAKSDLGAWWLGWPLIAAVHSLLAISFLFLPHHLQTSQVGGSAEESEHIRTGEK